MKEIIGFLLIFVAVFLLASTGLDSCSDLENTLKRDGLKSIIEDIWEGDKGGANNGSEPTTVH